MGDLGPLLPLDATEVRLDDLWDLLSLSTRRRLDRDGDFLPELDLIESSEALEPRLSEDGTVRLPLFFLPCQIDNNNIKILPKCSLKAFLEDRLAH